MLPLLTGITIVFYPVLPRGARRTPMETVAGAAVDDVDMATPVDDSDSDVDAARLQLGWVAARSHHKCS